MSNIDTQTTRSNKENRNLAKYKPFINNNQINFNFGNDFNYWYNDRFYGRKKIIYFYNQARYRIAIYFYNKNGVSINKKNKWFNHTETMKPAPLKITNEELESYASSVNNIKKFCDKNNIKLYIILIPNKSIIYKKESYPFIGISKEEKYSEQVQKYIYQKTRVKILYPIKELETEKKTIMYITKQIITGHFLEDMSDINI